MELCIIQTEIQSRSHCYVALFFVFIRILQSAAYNTTPPPLLPVVGRFTSKHVSRPLIVSWNEFDLKQQMQKAPLLPFFEALFFMVLNRLGYKPSSYNHS